MTVLSPMMDALQTADHVVKEGSWSFRCGPLDFEFLWPTHMMLEVRYRPNLVQLLRHRPGLKKKVERYDLSHAKLRDACRAAFERTLQSEAFQQLAESVGGELDSSDRKYFVEYVVNGIRDLSNRHSYRKLWEARGSDFLALRRSPVLSSSFEEIDRAGSEFTSALAELSRAIDDLQQHLADEFKLPPVEPAGSALY